MKEELKLWKLRNEGVVREKKNVIEVAPFPSPSRWISTLLWLSQQIYSPNHHTPGHPTLSIRSSSLFYSGLESRESKIRYTIEETWSFLLQLFSLCVSQHSKPKRMFKIRTVNVGGIIMKLLTKVFCEEIQIHNWWFSYFKSASAVVFLTFEAMHLLIQTHKD